MSLIFEFLQDIFDDLQIFKTGKKIKILSGLKYKLKFTFIFVLK